MRLKQSGAIIVGAAMLSFGSCSAPAEAPFGQVPSLEGDFDHGRLIIEADDGRSHELDVYLATSVEQQRRGLMFVRKMPQTTGMLFIYEGDFHHSMWMKNTYIPLDLVFARADGSVSSIIHDAEPLSLTSRASIEPVRYVLELNAGTARRLKIGIRSHIIWESSNAHRE